MLWYQFSKTRIAVRQYFITCIKHLSGVDAGRVCGVLLLLVCPHLRSQPVYVSPQIRVNRKPYMNGKIRVRPYEMRLSYDSLLFSQVPLDVLPSSLQKLDLRFANLGCGAHSRLAKLQHLGLSACGVECLPHFQVCC